MTRYGIAGRSYVENKDIREGASIPSRCAKAQAAYANVTPNAGRCMHASLWRRNARAACRT